MTTECVCHDWPNPNLIIKGISGHHESCKHAPKLDEALVMVIEGLHQCLTPDPKKPRGLNKIAFDNAVSNAQFVIDIYNNKEKK